MRDAGRRELVRRAARAAAVGAVAFALAGCGSASGGSGASLAWQGKPRLITTPLHAQVLVGRVTNRGGHGVDIEAKSMRALDQRGRPIRTSAVFLAGFVKSNFPHNKGQLNVPREERIRLGQIAEIGPGKSVPLTVSWREPRGPRRAIRVDTGHGYLAVPAAPSG